MYLEKIQNLLFTDFGTAVLFVSILIFKNTIYLTRYTFIIIIQHNYRRSVYTS